MFSANMRLLFVSETIDIRITDSIRKFGFCVFHKNFGLHSSSVKKNERKMFEFPSTHNQNFKPEIPAMVVVLALQGSKTTDDFPAN
jgi:hypothetical protein